MNFVIHQIHYVDEGIGMAFLVDDRKHPKLSARVKMTTKFYPLPEEVRKADRTWINLVIARVQPTSQELHWRPSTCSSVYAAMKVHIDEKTVMEAKPTCVYEDFVFVDNFKSWKVQEGRQTLTISMQNMLSRFSRCASNPEVSVVYSIVY